MEPDSSHQAADDLQNLEAWAIDQDDIERDIARKVFLGRVSCLYVTHVSTNSRQKHHSHNAKTNWISSDSKRPQMQLKIMSVN
jgi:hypothetical protein